MIARVLRIVAPAITVLAIAAISPAAEAAPARVEGAGRVGATHHAPTLFADAVSDTALDRYLGALSDSTDRYFGRAVAPLDTSGLDSSLVYGLAHPGPIRAGRRMSLLSIPTFNFNRVDGPTYGGAYRLGSPIGIGEISGRVAYAVGPNRWLGGGAFKKTWQQWSGSWSVRLTGGRSTVPMDRTLIDHGDEQSVFAMTSALIGGGDTRRYLRQDGFEARLGRAGETWHAGAAYRDMLESPLATTTTWNLLHHTPTVVENLPARFGRVHEGAFDFALRLPWTPIFSEVTYQTARRAIGSDLEYRRSRLALGGQFAFTRHATFVPQATYGRFKGELVPQAAFYLGGVSSLRSLEGAARGGTGLALARLDLIGSDDLLALAHIPHPGVLPIQAGAFATTGAVWGADPYGGPTAAGTAWPHREGWLSEAGVSLIYQPGIPSPTTMVRFDVAYPLGPGGRKRSLAISVTRAMDLLRPILN